MVPGTGGRAADKRAGVYWPVRTVAWSRPLRTRVLPGGGIGTHGRSRRHGHERVDRSILAFAFIHPAPRQQGDDREGFSAECCGTRGLEGVSAP